MGLLLDANLPERLKIDFAEHEIYTVGDKSWDGVKNGLLLSQLKIQHPSLHFKSCYFYLNYPQKHPFPALKPSELYSTYTELILMFLVRSLYSPPM